MGNEQVTSMLTCNQSDANAMDVHVGNQIRQIRNGYGESIQQLAKAIGVSESELRRMEIGQARTRPTSLIRIACYYEVPIRVFFQGS